MPDPVTRKTHNYDPDNFKVPEFRKDKNGKLDPTDYQAAVGLKDFMQRNDVLFINGDHHWEANNKGTVTFGDKVVQLNDKEKAMFKKLSDGLFRRLDAGDNGTHDGVVGGKDIDTAIKTPWKLHGQSTSKEGYWTDPAESLSITEQQAKERIQAFYKERGGGLYLRKFEWIANVSGTDDLKTGDPTLVQAAVMFLKHSDKVDADKDGYISYTEIRNWKI
ncbi:hypothetical protein RY831_11500 [Noviherbaspirillum sp. CPCC 100848]|uniref:EF-hand domain-containing protein n=1 Tax=Noviherbaspirillum album TaxID=3080276 RepID=A0ABU6J810_9BURK|nr:hypothetical protein [Noviherbaspirillum sp. CPCC 100848]MEC4719776.1 hypothetical protein [Noviherbaspirillum sp. CPCC 100848]